MLLDGGRTERGEEVLRDVIGEAAQGNDEIALVQGLVCLGALLCGTSRGDEAKPILECALSMRRDDDMLAVEFARAKALLSAHGQICVGNGTFMKTAPA